MGAPAVCSESANKGAGEMGISIMLEFTIGEIVEDNASGEYGEILARNEHGYSVNLLDSKATVRRSAEELQKGWEDANTDADKAEAMQAEIHRLVMAESDFMPLVRALAKTGWNVQGVPVSAEVLNAAPWKVIYRATACVPMFHGCGCVCEACGSVENTLLVWAQDEVPVFLCTECIKKDPITEVVKY